MPYHVYLSHSYPKQDSEIEIDGEEIAIFETPKLMNHDLTEGLQAVQYLDRQRNGKNIIIHEQEPWYAIFESLLSPLNGLLVLSALISSFVGEYDNAFSILLALLIVGGVAVYQDYQSSKQMDSLKNIVPKSCQVKRDGVLRMVHVEEVVVGDVVYLEAGDCIPADVAFLKCHSVLVDESSYTGESDAVVKNAIASIHKYQNAATSGYTIPFSEADFKEQGIMGTFLTHGNAISLCIRTGNNTQLAHIFEHQEKPKSALQLTLDKLAQQLSLISIIVIAFISFIGILQGRNLLETLTLGVSLAVAAIPEGLPIIISCTLAISVQRMASKQTLVKGSKSLESLGSLNLLCLDKTGTLTLNKLTVEATLTDFENSQNTQLLQRCAKVCSESKLSVDKCLKEWSKNAENWEEVEKQPFSSEYKWMGIIGELNLKKTLFVKGALDVILNKCTKYYNEDLSINSRAQLTEICNSWGKKGLRVIALAYKNNPSSLNDNDLTFIGLIGMVDPPRSNVQTILQHLYDGGIKCVIITGDQKQTAVSVAERAGLVNIKTMSGRELESNTEKQNLLTLSSVNIFYRTSPKHKLHIIQLYRRLNYVIGMTGDGVNDVAALRAADVGISMGTSMDVCKEASDLVLVDDNLSNIILAIEEGKSIFHIVQHFLRYQLTTSIAALSLIMMASLLSLATPMNAMMILWINILMDGPTAQSLAFEDIDEFVLKEPPRLRSASLLTADIIKGILRNAFLISFLNLFVFYLCLSNLKMAMTSVFCCFFFCTIFLVYSCKHVNKSVFKLNNNKIMNYTVGVTIIGQLATVYIPFMRNIFQTAILDLSTVLLIIIASSSVLVFDEFMKSPTRFKFMKRPRQHRSYSVIGQV